MKYIRPAEAGVRPSGETSAERGYIVGESTAMWRVRDIVSNGPDCRNVSGRLDNLASTRWINAVQNSHIRSSTWESIDTSRGGLETPAHGRRTEGKAGTI